MFTSTNVAVLTRGRVDRGGQTVLQNLSVTIPPGSLTVVTGANGSGKSTLLSVLAGLQPLDEGTLSVTQGIRRAFVPQRSEASDNLPLTVADVVAMGRWFGPRRRNRAEDRAIVSASLSAVGLFGLEARTLGELSGGQRQRAFLAQGLAQRADLLLLDEPTSGLDDKGIQLLVESIARERARGAAVVLVTHHRHEVLDSHRHVHVTDGAIEIHESASY